jgi:pentatricopeptide repeat protein
MAYASLVGKDLVDLSNEEKSDEEVENRIFSTYNQRQNSIRAIALKATNLSSTFDQVADDVVPDSEKSVKQPRERFLDSLTILQVEEAKATAKAQLGLAFEMLEIMRDRELKADPVTYRCLIDACGRCGDTDRATELLARMHEDGIVADGIVYSCLVSAFSAENTWRKVSGTSTDHLPGKFFFFFLHIGFYEIIIR